MARRFLRSVNVRVWSKRTTTGEQNQGEWMNYEFFGLYRRFRDERMSKTKAVETAAEMCRYGPSRAWEIVKLREGKAS